MSLPETWWQPAGLPGALSLRLADAADVTALHQALYADRAGAAFARHFHNSLRRQTQARCYWPIATGDDGIVAGVQLLREGARLEIANLAVGAKWQEQGIGTYLLQIATELAVHWGHERMEINVASGNKRALALYTRLGFKQDRVYFVPDGSWAVRLTRAVA